MEIFQPQKTTPQQAKSEKISPIEEKKAVEPRKTRLTLVTPQLTAFAADIDDGGNKKTEHICFGRRRKKNSS